MSDREAFLRAFHATNPGATSRALARGDSYERLARDVLAARAVRGNETGRVLDLACGDGYLTRLLGPGAIGLDVSEEVGPTVRGRAQQLPFADGAFDVVVCHLAFMLFDDVEAVVAELARVLRPGGSFHALVGGGPTADGADTFHAFAALLPAGGIAFGDPRSSRESGWCELFGEPTWSGVAFERRVIDLTGRFEDVWAFLGTSYQLAEGDRERVRGALRARFPSDPVPCAVATYAARVTRGFTG